MVTQRIQVPGRADEVRKAEAPVAGAGATVLAEVGATVTVRAAVRVGGTRAAEAPVEIENVKDDDVVEVTFDDGAKLLMRADEAQEGLGGAATRAPARPGTLVIGTSFPLEMRARGAGEWVIAGLRVLGVDLAGATARQIAEKVDARLVPNPGLHRWTGEALEPVTAALPADEKPWLLFLHGTFSTTPGSFSQLSARTEEWGRLKERYGDRILGLEHRTLTESPTANALQAVEHLPPKATLHLVGYSRGGLVGEMLCRAQLEGRKPFDDIDLGLFAGDGRTQQRKELEELGKQLIKAQPRVERYVRVACPARGTVLASDRLDKWLNVVFNVFGLAVGAVASPVGGEIYDLLQAFLLAVVKERSKPETIPGIEAMMPAAPLIRMLNRPDVTSTADLAIITGDFEGAGLLGRLKVWASDLFYREEHDLVVNTGAMDGGMARTGGVRAFLDQGADVDHFHYFVNGRTATQIVRGLLRKDDEFGDFKPIEVAVPLRLPTPAVRGAERRPLVFVVPGITGSYLHIEGKRVWIDVKRLAFGGLGRLAIDAAGVSAGEPMGRYYADLCESLGRSHDVVPWGYDWRRSILDTAVDFGAVLKKALAETEQPVRIVAHSMGGLIARSAFLNRELWDAFRGRTGARLVMLGTPNGGSWSIPYMLMGRNRLMGYLSALDLKMTRREQQQMIARWPGALQMLPQEDLRLFSAQRWEELLRLEGSLDWVPPLATDLAQAELFRSVFPDKAPIDPSVMVYLAGQSETLTGIIEDDTAAERVTFRVTMEGDGQVLWRTGIPAGVRAWYLRDVVHGDLARHEPAFPAILDLLERGTTSLLPETPPAVTRGARDLPPRARDATPIFPNEDDLELAAMDTRPSRARSPKYPRIKLRVVHGHLAFANYPVLVGHYAGDTINGAESELDSALDKRLTERRKLGLYPGAVGTTTVVLDPKLRPAGAIIVGLGDPGDVAPGKLFATLRQGLLAYAVERRDDDRLTGRGEGWLGVSALLVGSGAGGLEFPDCITALLRAVGSAQQALDGRIEEIEILENVEGRAIRAWHDVRRALRLRELDDQFELYPCVDPRSGGRRNVMSEEDRSWFLPIQITMDVPTDGERFMRFVTVSGRARAEERLVPGNTGFVERFVAQATRSSDRARSTAAGRALFELLWPNRVKETSRDDRNLRLILDEATAGYPWELLDDRRPWTETDGLSDQRRRPPAIRARLVRQLVQGTIRENVADSRGSKQALVIGDPRAEPQPDFPTLFGARMEAEDVAQRLRQGGYEVTALIGDKISPDQVVSALFSQAWTIIHIAAHGTVDQEVTDRNGKTRKVTGVVLGGDLFLSTSILDQLPRPPLLAFVNCCHLGKIDATQETAQRILQAQQSRRPQLAANIAVQLVRMGVRGVVAAGWPVDDTRAAQFALKLYDSLLDGDSFADAVFQARGSIYADDGGDTTWGAYQCYGDPDWRLDESAERTELEEESKRFASLAEAVARTEEIRERAQVGLDRDLAAFRKGLDAVDTERKRNNSFLDKAELRLALAEAYAEIGAWTKAIRHYEAAIGAASGRASLRAVEQCQNLKVRLAQHSLGKASKTAERRAAADAMKDAIKKLRDVVALVGETSERHSMIGGCFKRLAWIESGKARADALQEMRQSYTTADARAAAAKGSIFYPRLVTVALDLVDHPRSKSGRIPDDASLWETLKSAEADAEKAKAKAGDVWAEIALADAKLLRALADGKISDAEEDTIVAAYLVPRSRISRLKLGSVTEHLDFLTAIFGGGRGSSLTQAIARIRTRLAREFDG